MSTDLDDGTRVFHAGWHVSGTVHTVDQTQEVRWDGSCVADELTTVLRERLTLAPPEGSPVPAVDPAKNLAAGPGLPNSSDDDSRGNPMVSATLAEAAVEEFTAADMLSPRDYGAAFDAYAAVGSEADHAVALNRAVDAVAGPLTVEILERLYRRLMVTADAVATGRLDAFEFGLRVAATEARAMGRELAGGESR